MSISDLVKKRIEKKKKIDCIRYIIPAYFPGFERNKNLLFSNKFDIYSNKEKSEFLINYKSNELSYLGEIERENLTNLKTFYEKVFEKELKINGDEFTFFQVKPY